jgi:hypothetical protein
MCSFTLFILVSLFGSSHVSVICCHHMVGASFVQFFGHIGHIWDQEEDNWNAKSLSIQRYYGQNRPF